MIFTQMHAAIAPTLKKIHAHPFNQELSQGVLANDKFNFYLLQDALYLRDFSKALALTAARLPCHQQTQNYLQFALDAIQAEQALHLNYLKADRTTLLTNEQGPACFMYTNYLLRMATLASPEEAAASLLPCFWVYRDVGQQILAAQNTRDNPYQDWIALYSGELFDLSVNTAVNIINELGETASMELKNKMLAAFVRSTQLEWMFWDSAYRLEGWQ